MGTKEHPGKFDCYSNALPDEPLFTLLARDPSAPELLRLWADNRRKAIVLGQRLMSDWAMTDEAYECATRMEQWRILNDGIWRQCHK